MSKILRNHYQNLASIYDNLWFYSEDFVQFITSKLIEHCRLNRTDILVDLGCGTGIYAQEINNKIQLHNAIICVDYSDNMLEQIPNNSKYSRAYHSLRLKPSIHKFGKYLYSLLYKASGLPQVVLGRVIN
ncbi:class I SAM-dependent methyltransferase [Nostoc sp.]|uniref:class I SAM-dependent methyltransferase n=1 Tax=Nostoc sp. TaxID=1180 RepID=UPI002FF4692E